MKKTKRVFFNFGMWEIKEIAKYFDRMSAEGWQVKKVGAFTIHFTRDTTVRYRHQVDCHSGAADSRYLSAFTEQGWEHIKGFESGLKYFRKPYDPALPESEYEIYTDEQSYKEMLDKSIKRQVGLTITYFCIALMYSIVGMCNGLDAKSMDFLGMLYYADGVMFLICAILFLTTAIQLGRLKKGKKTNIKGSTVNTLSYIACALFLVFVIGGGVVALSRNVRTRLDTNIAIGEVVEQYNDTLNFSIDKTGYYYLDLDMEAEKGSVGVEIKNADGEVVFDAETVNGKYSVDDECIRFTEGDYTAELTAPAGTTDAEFSVNLIRSFR